MKYKKCNSLIPKKNIATMDHADEYRPIDAVDCKWGPYKESRW